MDNNVGAATALVGLSVFQIHNLYASHAGQLEDSRQSSPNDRVVAQRLRDADILTGVLAFMVGSTVSRITRSSTPLWLTLSAYGVVAVYYHSAHMSEGTT